VVAHEGRNGSQARVENDEIERLLEAIAVDGVTLAREARRLARIERERLRVAVTGSFTLAAGLLMGGIVACFLAVAAGLRTLDGLAGGLGAWLDAEWAGDLVGGLIGLIAVVGALALARDLRDRARVAALRRKLEEQS